MEKETRSLQNKIQVRNTESGEENVVSGYAAIFDEESEVLGFGFTESIDRNAFSKTDFSKDDGLEFSIVSFILISSLLKVT